MVRRNIELETRLIEDLLDLTRVTSGKLQLHIRPAYVHELLRHVLAACARDISARKLDVRLLPDATNDLVAADASRLQQVFWNVLRNAIKYTPEGGRIRIQTTSTPDGQLRVDIEDSGMGIPAETLPRIFDAFEQGDEAMARRSGGLGLGLAIAKAVMELHGGQIWAESKGAGLGSRFSVQLPLAPVQASVDATAPRGELRKGTGAKVLLVEDHPDTARVLARLLSQFGYTVKSAHTVRTAMNLADAERFDVVVSDIGLPDATGYELMQSVRQRHGLPGIAISGYGMESDIAKSREAGFADHLVKPINLPHLHAVIQRLVKGAA
jgi:CheY-like chemotaxis protein